MKIILEGTVKELQNAIRTFGIPKEVMVDDGVQTVSYKAFKKFKKAVKSGMVDRSYKPNAEPVIDLDTMAERAANQFHASRKD